MKNCIWFFVGLFKSYDDVTGKLVIEMGEGTNSDKLKRKVEKICSKKQGCQIM